MGQKQAFSKDSAEWRKGHSGELKIAEFLKRRGWYVNPTFEYSGEEGDHAPMMGGAQSKMILPDMDIAKSGDRKWAEIKSKSRPSFTWMTRQFEHGLPLRQWNHYLNIQQETGCEVWLFIYETEGGHVIYNSLNILDPIKRVDHSDKMDRSGMVFFPRTAFGIMGILKDDGVWAEEGMNEDILWEAQEVYSLNLGSQKLSPHSQKLEDNHSPEVDALRDRLYAIAQSNEFEPFEINPGETIIGGEENWAEFCRYSRPHKIRQALSLMGQSCLLN